MYYYAYIVCEDYAAIRLGQMLGLGLERPVGVVRDKIVVSINEAARRVGLCAGMRLSEAQSLGTGAILDQYAYDLDQKAQRDWLDTCLKYGNRLENAGPGEAYLDLEGQVDLVQTLEMLGKEIGKRHGYQIRTGIAGARWLAKTGGTLTDFRPIRLELEALPFIEDAAEYCAELPVQALPVSPKASAMLSDLGYATMADLRELAMPQLKSYFGKEALCIYWACRGQWHDPIRANYPCEDLHDEIEFPGGIDDSLQMRQAIMQMAQNLAARMSGKGLQVQEAALLIETEDQAPHWERLHWQKAITRASGLGLAIWLAYEKLKVVGLVHKVKVSLLQLRQAEAIQQSLGLFGGMKDAQREFEAAAQPIKNVLGEKAIIPASQMQVSRRQAWLREWINATGWR